MFNRRAGTSGIRGHLYETKLISLLYLRAIQDSRIFDFKLGSNVDNIGRFDDICFIAEVTGKVKPVAVFIETRHSMYKRHTYKINLATYFESYLKIRQAFLPSNRDSFFKGTFEEIECLFAIYTNARVDLRGNSVRSGISSIVNDLIDTGGTVQQPYISVENVEYLKKIVIKEKMISLAERLVKFMMNNDRYNEMMSDNLVLRYHVVLAQNVVDVSDIQPSGHRVAFFRHEFFDTQEEYLILLKETLFKEIIKNLNSPSFRKPSEITNLNDLVSEILDEPNDVIKVSKMIGTVATYNKGQLKIDKRYEKISKTQLNIDFSESTINQAVELVAKEILCREFKVPVAFGNKDLTIRGSDMKVQRRIKYLTSKMKILLKEYECSKIVCLDDSLDHGFLQLNGGLASAIGNIFVLDKNTKLMKITDNEASLGYLAQKLYKTLKDEINNLHEYSFHFEGIWFPILSFNCSSDYEENLATDFLNNLLLYSNQASNDALEEIIINEIETYQLDKPNYFKAKADMSFIKYHDYIQKWWQSPHHAPYLTQKDHLFQRVINEITKGAILATIDVMSRIKITQYDYTFTEDAVRYLNLQEQHSSTVIIAENIVLTVVKVMHRLKNKDFAVIDLEYIANLQTNDRTTLLRELEDTDESKILVIIYYKMQHSWNEKILENIAEAVLGKKTIIVTDRSDIEILQYFPKIDITLFDKKLCLADMSEESQKRILETATVEFGCVEMSLDLLMRGWPIKGKSSLERQERSETQIPTP